MKLRCRVSSRCPWGIDENAYDSDGQRSDHETECRRFLLDVLDPITLSKRAATRLEVERLDPLWRKP